MESTNVNDAIKILPPLPSTERLFSSCLSISPCGKFIAYCANSIIVIRNLENPKESKIFTEHIKETSAFTFATNGFLVASGDVEGNIKIWNLETMIVTKEKKVLSSKILGLEFNDTNKRLLIYGYGRGCVKYLNWETFSGDTEFGGHVKNLLSADIKKTKPYQIITGAEDFTMTFHQGPPFKLISNKKEHNNFVSCVKFSPDYTKFASTGFDKKINIWNTNENTILFTLDLNIPNAHTMSIISLIWIDENTLATTSVDKTVKIWDLESKSVKFTLYPVDKSQFGESQIGCSVTFSHSLRYLIMLTLEGKLNIWNFDNLENEKLPDIIIKGHQNSLTHIKYSSKFEKLFSLDNVGRICEWDKEENIQEFTPSSLKSNDFCLLENGTEALSVNYNGEYFKIDLIGKNIILKGSVKGDPQKIRAINKKENCFIILLSERLVMIENGTQVKEVALKTQSNALDINELKNEIYVGDQKGNLLTFDIDLNLINTSKIFDQGIFIIKTSNIGNLIAMADNVKFIYIVDAETKEPIIRNFVFHNGKIYDLAWNEDDSNLLSCSLDRSTILWDIAKKSKIKKYEFVDKESCNSVTWLGKNGFAVGGAMGSISKFNL